MKRRGVLCFWVSRHLDDRASPASLRATIARRHRRLCPDCAEQAEWLARVEKGLAAIAADRAGPPPGHLRMRVLDAVEREQREQREAADRRRPGWLGRSLWTGGALAAALLVVAIAWSRRDALSAPPRTVRIALPAAVTLRAEPSIVVRRADGRIERR